MVVVGALLVDSLAQPSVVLAARRTSPPDLAGRWEFPGGKVEAGETPQQALAREIREELGVEVSIGEELRPESGTTWPISKRYELRLFYGVVARGVPPPGESHDEVRWLDAESLETVDWLDSDRAALPFVFCQAHT